MNGAMAIPNLIGLMGLSGLIATETADYFGARAKNLR
jgi:AGCS family alanine or glycine:cation symporter